MNLKNILSLAVIGFVLGAPLLASSCSDTHHIQHDEHEDSFNVDSGFDNGGSE